MQPCPTGEEDLEKTQDYTRINQLFRFLDGAGGEQEQPRPPLNDTLTGYFCKVCLIIISYEPIEMFRYIESTDYKVIDQLL